MTKITDEAKHKFLKQVLEGKDILLGKQSSQLTNSMKDAGWTEVFNWAEENGMPFIATARAQTKLPPFKYVRDHVYSHYCQQFKVGCLCARSHGCR